MCRGIWPAASAKLWIANPQKSTLVSPGDPAVKRCVVEDTRARQGFCRSLGGTLKWRAGGCGTPNGVDTVSLCMIRIRTTVDSGGNAGLPGRQALHTQASSATL